jgi:arsenite methyltransferase
MTLNFIIIIIILEQKMQTDEELKQIVKDKYGKIALNVTTINQGSAGCCGCGSDGYTFDYSIMGDDYSNIEGYIPDADLGLGCGLPTEFAKMKTGDTVLDLGSGAGNDVFIARQVVGETGKVIGVDMTQEMYDKANLNREKLGYKNVEFRIGEIESLPVDENSIDVVISNCVLNLVPNKDKAFSEIYRVLKPGGHFCISDIVLNGELPMKIKAAAEMYAGCVAGALQRKDYLKIIDETGFKNVSLPKIKKITIPDSIMLNFLNETEMVEFKNSGLNIESITVYGEK